MMTLGAIQYIIITFVYNFFLIFKIQMIKVE